jgi:hypothetical protein
VVASKDSTLIEIKPSVLTLYQNYTGLQPGVSKMITLQKGQVYQVLGANQAADSNGNGGTGVLGFELTGTSIRSLSIDKPIAVFSGSSRTLNKASCGSGGGDNDMVQVFPLHMWGKKYLTAPLPSSSSASYMSTSIYKIIVNDSTTIVSRNGVILSGLINSSYYLYESNQPDYIEANKPIMVAQFMTGGSCTTGLGDPDMYYISPIDAGIKQVNCVRTMKESITINYVTLIIPTTGLNSLLIDGSSTFNHSYAHPALPGYTVVIKSWTAAITQFSIQSDSAFTGISYGMGNVESYGYNLGANFSPSNGVDPLVPMVWTGTISTDWFTAGNWSTVRVPTEIDHVRIPGGTPFSPAIQNGRLAYCKSISVEANASVNVGSSANLNVTGK